MLPIPRPSPKLLLPILAIAILSLSSYAGTVSVSSTTVAARYGLTWEVTGSFTATDGGFSTTASNAVASSQPCSWSNGGTCRTALTKGRLQYVVTLTLQTPPSSTTTYTVTVNWDQGSGMTQMGQLTVSVPNTASPGQSVTFRFDTGSTSVTTPLAIDVTVA